MTNSDARPVTLRSIADELGLHVSTVSRVLNASDDDAASSETIERIRDLAHERGYRPNPHATSLRTQRSKLIGVLVPRLSDLVLATIYEGIDEAAVKVGLSTFVTNTQDDPAEQRARTEMMINRRVDGLIIGDAHTDAAMLDELAGHGHPFVLVNRHASHYPSVTCDDYLGGRLVADHLLGIGHEQVAVIAGEAHASTGIDRTAGFVDRYNEAGFPVPQHWIVNSRFDTKGGREAAERILTHSPGPTAIFAVNDFAAIGAAGAARDHGLSVGTDLALVGFNDTPLAAELPVPLTSVGTSMQEIGRQATDLLVKLLNGDDVESRRLPPTLMIRASSKAKRRG